VIAHRPRRSGDPTPMAPRFRCSRRVRTDGLWGDPPTDDLATAARVKHRPCTGQRRARRRLAWP
jgi:hypothetical protein